MAAGVTSPGLGGLNAGGVELVFVVALESVVDRVGSERHPLSGQAKDLGSAAVFLTLVLFWLIWGPSLWYFYRASTA